MKTSEILTNNRENAKAKYNEMCDKLYSREHRELDSDKRKELETAVRQLHTDIQILEYQIQKAKNHEVEVGDGVTIRYYTDAHAGTVIRKTKTMLVIQQDKATLDPNFKPEFDIGGFAAHCTNNNEQTYSYERDPNGTIFKARWSEKYGCYKSDGFTVSTGRHEFYDYNF